MKKAELVELVAEKAGLTKADATRALEAVFETVTEALAKGEKVPVAGFGKVKIAARNAVTFKAGTALKDAVN